MRKYWKIIFLICLLNLILLLRCWEYQGDDVYIPLVYARNLATGYGFSFNPGQPSYGFTSPLWIIILSFFYILSLEDLFFVAKLISITFSVLTIPTLYFLAKELIKNEKISILSVFFWAIEPWLLRWGVFGIETSLFIFLVLLGLIFLYKNEKVSAILLGLSAITRPEAFLFFPLLLTKNIMEKKFLLITIFLLIVIPWLIYSQTTFGSILPLSIYPKGGVSVTTPRLLFDEIFIYIISLFILLPFLPLSIIYFIKKDFLYHMIPIFWVIGVAVFYLISASTSSRYVLPVIPVALIYSLYGLEKFCKNRRIFYLLLFCFFVEIVAMDMFVITFYPRIGKEFMDVHYYTAEWIKNNTKRDAVIYALDIGAIGYVSGRKVLDYKSLAVPESYSFNGTEIEWIMLKKPDYFFEYDDVGLANSLNPYLTKIFTRNYTSFSIRALHPVSMSLYKFNW